jgi:hypothetical protein
MTRRAKPKPLPQNAQPVANMIACRAEHFPSSETGNV